MKKNILICVLLGFGMKCFCSPIDILNQMNVEESLKYTLENQKDKITITAQLSKDNVTINAYGCDGEIVDTKKYENNIYEIGSLTKTFTALLICKAQREGKLNIDDSIEKYLDLSNFNKQKKYYPTIKKILTHTSGYKSHYMAKGMTMNHLNKINDFYGITREQILEQVAKTNLKENKKYDFVYSNFGYAVLGLVLESVYKNSYTNIVNDFVQKELGMKNTFIANGKGNLKNYWDWKKDDGYLSAGALYSTISDMIIYAKLQLSGKDIFSDCHEMMDYAKTSSPMYTKMGIYMDKVGYAWILDKTNDVIWHNGATGSFNCYFGFNMEKQKAVIVLSDMAPDYRIPATVVGTKMIKNLLKN